MDRNKTILKNTVIFAIGNFGSKILTYVMVLVYTHFISADNLGYYDLILTTISLLQPIILLAFDEGLYRWLIGIDTLDKKTVVSTCLRITTVTSIGTAVLFVILNLKFHFRYVGLIALFLVSALIYQMVLNAVRGLSSNKLYAASGILNSFLVLVLEIIGLIPLHLGIEALLLSKLLANFITIGYIFIKQQELLAVFTIKTDRLIAKDVLRYSLPLIPNQISWWIINSSDRYIILFFLGTAFNGIYSVATKFPTVIMTITSIVYMSLQETIIKEYHSEDRNQFYSQTFQKYYILLFTLVICAIPASKVIILLFVGAEYRDAWMYTDFLLLGTVFMALSSLLGIGYQISKETSRSVISTISAAGINLLVNLILVQFIGLHAASFSTLFSYFLLFVLRIQHSKKYFTLHIKWPLFVFLACISIIVSIISYINNTTVNIIISIIGGVLLLYFNRGILKKFFRRKAGVKK